VRSQRGAVLREVQATVDAQINMFGAVSARRAAILKTRD
jgi:hypothetical protein